ncbi:hypothetical protein ER13_08630 [Brevundimonas sp. EAKA]|uniref:hypothetical protein n=1 Tax=Brevundimonas sp. EAKA TaxID=1495854 RepID=UPI0004A9532D|nr:hypothetical protein [Brevundimonas sp. EAKA]KDP94914.1 hypothetical protein ER13_08630 [Brevundimonas sp. EAKA]
MAQAHASFWEAKGISHALTISAGSSAGGLDRSALSEVMKRLIKEASHELRLMPRRLLRNAETPDPNTLFLAGFIESKMRSGEPFIHWHGGVALRGAEEIAFRDLLCRRIGEDADAPLAPHEPTRTIKPILPTIRTPLTFHLTRLTTASRFIRYANKQATSSDFDIQTTSDFLNL